MLLKKFILYQLADRQDNIPDNFWNHFDCKTHKSLEDIGAVWESKTWRTERDKSDISELCLERAGIINNAEFLDQ